MKRLLFILLSLLALPARSQELPDSIRFNNEYLDTVQVFNQKEINDYSMIGFSYGEVISRMMITPYQHQRNIWTPGHYAVTFTHYEKMFDYIPYFGFQIGVAYSYEGMRFKYDEDSSYIPVWDDYSNYLLMRIIEVPFHAQLHFDAPPFKLMANAGIYGAYRLDIDRQGVEGYMDPEFSHAFHDYEIRWDYGLEGGMSLGFMFDPIELHVGALVRYSWGSMYKPDYHSEYYYRYAYPFDIMLTCGIHFQITRRTGKTNAALRREARNIVFGDEK